MLQGFLRWYGNREIGEVTPEDVRACMVHEEERGLAPSTIARLCLWGEVAGRGRGGRGKFCISGGV
jgi:hypothetical protein